MSDAVFAGTVPELYDRLLGPMIFAPYAAEMAALVVRRAPRRILEVAAGTGVVTRELARTLPADVSIVATDLNQPMLDRAIADGIARPVEWQRADAMRLPFDDGAFDVVVCQFGAMFFPDKSAAFAEVRRVLRPGGTFALSVWDRIEENDFAATVTSALAQRFLHDPPRFLARTPHGYHDVVRLRRDLAAAGFTARADVRAVTHRSPASSARIAAVAYCEGTPLRDEIEERASGGLAEATALAADALRRQFGDGAIDGRIQAHVATVER